MAILRYGDLAVERRGVDEIVLKVPVAGRVRQVRLDALAAQRIGTDLANAGFDGVKPSEGFTLVEDVKLRPYDDTGHALLQLDLQNFGGPVVLRIPARVLKGLAQIAEAALEFSEGGGKA